MLPWYCTCFVNRHVKPSNVLYTCPLSLPSLSSLTHQYSLPPSLPPSSPSMPCPLPLPPSLTLHPLPSLSHPPSLTPLSLPLHPLPSLSHPPSFTPLSLPLHPLPSLSHPPSFTPLSLPLHPLPSLSHPPSFTFPLSPSILYRSFPLSFALLPLPLFFLSLLLYV